MKKDYHRYLLPLGQRTLKQIEEQIKEAIDETRSVIQEIETATDAPTVNNTFEKLDEAIDRLQRAGAHFHQIENLQSSPEAHEVSMRIHPLMAGVMSDMYLSAGLFKRIKILAEGTGMASESEQARRLVKLRFEDFKRSGALLSDAQKAELRTIDQRLAALGPQIQQNALQAMNAFVLDVTEKSRIAALPTHLLESAQKKAESRGLHGWSFGLDMPTYSTFMKFCADRELREKLARAYGTLATEAPHDNRELIREVAALRANRAALLGYKNHAALQLEPRMVRDARTVHDFLGRLIQPAQRCWQQEKQRLQARLERDHPGETLKPWDLGYYSERIFESEYRVSEQEVRPYLQVDRVVEGAFWLCGRLWGITFQKVSDIPVLNDETVVYEVRERDLKFLGLLYLDLFPRANKRSGAWQMTLVPQVKDRRPHATIAGNFTRPSAETPSLLSFNEATTFFHELGHALHTLFSDVEYSALSGTNVALDFVELPSQLFEEYLYELPVLQNIAVHYQTGEPIPAELVERLRRSRQFLMGYAYLRQSAFVLLDLAWHELTGEPPRDVEAFEREITKEVAPLPKTPGAMISPNFLHIFAGGYDAGYYSYKWSEVLAADAYAVVSAEGVLDSRAAERYRRTILSKGDSADPAQLFRDFAGREPREESLLKRDGLVA